MLAQETRLRLPASWLFIFLVAQLLSSCKDLGVEMSASGPLLPLAAGNRWQYLDYYLTTNADTLTITLSPLTVTGQGGLTYPAWLWQTQVGKSLSGIGFLYRNDSWGLQMVGVTAPHDTLLTLAPDLKCPVGVGDSWQEVVTGYDPGAERLFVIGRRTVDCVSITDRFSTPAGDFSPCIVYHWRELPAEDVAVEWDYFDYWMPALGWVGRVIRSVDDNSVISKTVLLTYRIN